MQAHAEWHITAPIVHHRMARTDYLTQILLFHRCPLFLTGLIAHAQRIWINKFVQNLTSINSRPSQIRAWKYVFLVEGQYVPTSENADAVSKIIDGLQFVTEGCRHLGTWADQLVDV